MKSGKEYELFIKEIYEYLNRADGLYDVVIQHDIKLTGLSGVARQIDVYWTFKRAGVPYRVAIECKHYKSAVSVDKVSAFHDVLNDLQGVKGIIATSIGFQKGAEEWAKKYGIQAMIIRHPIDEDWEGRVKDVQLNIIASTVDNIRVNVVADNQRAGEMVLPSVFLAQCDSTKISYSEIVGLRSEPGEITIKELIDMLPQDKEPNRGITHSFKFIDGTINNHYPISELQFVYDVLVISNNVVLYGDEEIKAIIKDITGGTETIVDRFGNVKDITT